MKSRSYIALIAVALAHPALAELVEKRYEIEADLDGDGFADRLISEPVRDFGNSGGHWDVLLSQKDGSLLPAGSIFAHPAALRIENADSGTRLWVYLRAGASSGTLGYHTFSQGHVSEIVKIEISPGDGGTDIGRAIYSAIFPPASRLLPIERDVEKMRTEPNKAMEPIPVDVTDCATAHSAPSTFMAHLRRSAK